VFKPENKAQPQAAPSTTHISQTPDPVLRRAPLQPYAQPMMYPSVISPQPMVYLNPFQPPVYMHPITTTPPVYPYPMPPMQPIYAYPIPPMPPVHPYPVIPMPPVHTTNMRPYYQTMQQPKTGFNPRPVQPLSQQPVKLGKKM